MSAGAREELAATSGLRLLGSEELGRGGAYDRNLSKITIEVARLGVARYAIDDSL